MDKTHKDFYKFVPQEVIDDLEKVTLENPANILDLSLHDKVAFELGKRALFMYIRDCNKLALKGKQEPIPEPVVGSDVFGNINK